MKIAAALFLILPAASPAQQIAIAEYPIPSPTSSPSFIVAGPDGAVWFVNGPQIGRVTPAGKIIQYPTTPPWDVQAITAGPDGAIWFIPAIPSGAQIGRITNSGVVTEFPLPNPASQPLSIVAGSDGALWFTDHGTNMIGRITTAGVVTEYLVPIPGAGVANIASGPDGALWFTQEFTSNIGRINAAGVVTEYPLPPGTGGLFGGIFCCITAGPDGALWFTGVNINGTAAIGRIATDGVVTEFPVGGAPYGIAAGPDGALWFTGGIFNGNVAIGRITTAGVVSYYPGAASYITEGPDGHLWLTGTIGNGGVYTPGVIEEMVFVTANLAVTPAGAWFGSSLQFTGTGFAPNEPVEIYMRGVGSAVLAGATADAGGSFTVPAQAPQSPYLFGAPRIFLGVGQSSGKLGAASFTSETRLKLTPDSGPVGSTATIIGYGFGPFEYITVYWNNPQTPLGAVAADINGTFNGKKAIQFTVPAGAAPGTNHLVARGTYGGASRFGTFIVQ